MCINWL